MSSNLHWDEWAETIVTEMVRPEKGEELLVLADTATDPGMAQACLAAGLRAGAETQLLVYKRMAWGEAKQFGKVVLDAIRASRLILGLHSNFVGTEATRDMMARGGRVLATQPWGIEDFLLRGVLDVDYGAMIRNGEVMKQLWSETDECRVVSEEGTDIQFKMGSRRVIVSDGMLTEDGEVDFVPGVQVSIAPIEETINGRIVVDASDNMQGVVEKPYTMEVENGVVKGIEGGLEASKIRAWMETRNDETIYHLCHFTVGLNPKAGISGNMLEDERLLGCADFGFGSQMEDFGGTVGLSPYHMDVILASPTILLDGRVMCERNELNSELGFEQVSI